MVIANDDKGNKFYETGIKTLIKFFDFLLLFLIWKDRPNSCLNLEYRYRLCIKKKEVQVLELVKVYTFVNNRSYKKRVIHYY